MLGDCVELMDGLHPGSIQLTVTSPPYDNLRSYNNTLDDWSESKWESVLRGLYRLTSEGGCVVWIVSDAVEDGSETGSSFKQALYAMSVGFKLHDTMIWKKPNFSNPSKTRYHQVFEYMFVFSKGKPKTFRPIHDRKNVMSGKVGSYGENTVTQADGSKLKRKESIVREFGMRHNVWDVKTSGQLGESKRYKHPAMFPVSLAKDHVLSWTNEGDTVLDPFMGSGSTGVACVETGRSFVGFERDENYFRTAKERIGNTKGS